MLDTLYWDLPRLFEEIKVSLGKAARTEVALMVSALTPGALTLA